MMEEDHDSYEDIEKKEFEKIKKSTNTFLVAVLIIVVVIAIILVSIFLKGDDNPGVQQYKYNGFSVINISGLWYTQIDIPGKDTMHNIEMRYGPMQVETVPLQTGVIDKIENSDMIYLTTDPDSGAKVVIAMIEIGRLTGDKYDLLNIPTHGALTEENSESLHITCENATASNTVIDFRVGNITKIYQEGNCVIIQGTDDDEVIRASDRIGYSILGLME